MTSARPTAGSLTFTIFAVLAIAAFALPLGAESFVITLKNGSTIESRYQPQEASWDSGLVLFMTESGNWVGMPKSEVASVVSHGIGAGFGFVINPTTIAIGWSPNDAEEASADPQADFGAQILRALGGGAAPSSAPRTPYSIQQGVSTEQTQGIPLGYVPGSEALGGSQAPQAPVVNVIAPGGAPTPEP